MLVKCYISQHWQNKENIPIMVKRDPTLVKKKQDNMPEQVEKEVSVVIESMSPLSSDSSQSGSSLLH